MIHLEKNHLFVITVLAAAIGLSTQANATDFVEGKDYTVLKNPDQINNSGDTIIVREFFWYGCPHCYHLESHMDKWAKNKPNDVAFFLTPAALNPVWETSARGFYAAQLMGYQGKTHHKLFNAVMEKGQKNLAGTNKGALINWYTNQGLDKEKFNNLYDSFAVNTKIARSNTAAKRYGVTGTPAVIVHGKYMVQGSDEKVPQVVNYLVDKVRAEK
ncbi:MAG: disulfide bond formation protein DsbA [Gammaproteobacteria bacterium]|nr:MAG: disulfide bond formation protein DsbA [Gammaproteobacteria bacterium]